MSSPHLQIVLESSLRLQDRLSGAPYILDGGDLQVADVVATAFWDIIPQLTQDEKISSHLNASVTTLMNHLTEGSYVYGVNTGFGGSADSRTEHVFKLQAALMQLTQAGIMNLNGLSPSSLPAEAMPQPWVRATIVVRCNATIRGHSAVSLPVLQSLQQLLQHRITPVTPLRGSVSASGDLMPLSYIAGALEGNPSILVQCGGDDQPLIPADQALQRANILPITLGPKEGLGLVNGTASSAALGALVMHQTHQLALLAQALTGIAVEALEGSAESFHPFIAAVRPHPGQIETARNISAFLRGSYLARDMRSPKNLRRDELIQDRYSLRSAPQWIGPQLEELCLSDRQIVTELNSSCDNPLVDVSTGKILYGCNFQAASVTSAMDRTRLSLQMIGRILSAQFTEMVDPHLSSGLPANLVADDPSLSFGLKGVDISMAAYLAELSFLANPMGSHVQPAEMYNQSINSMAFASARQTMQSVDILTLMSACSIYGGCQALDLRVLHRIFISSVKASVATTIAQVFGSDLPEKKSQILSTALCKEYEVSWKSTSKLDLQARCRALVNTAIPTIIDMVAVGSRQISLWKEQAFNSIWSTWTETVQDFSRQQPTEQFLGSGSSAVYRMVRGDLKVPFNLGFVEHPTLMKEKIGDRQKKTIGEWISIIYAAIQKGSFTQPLLHSIVGEPQNGSHQSNCNLNGKSDRANGYTTTTNGHASKEDVNIVNGNGYVSGGYANDSSTATAES